MQSYPVFGYKLILIVFHFLIFQECADFCTEINDSVVKLLVVLNITAAHIEFVQQETL